MLSASNIPLPDHPPTKAGISTSESVQEQQTHGTLCLLLPAFVSLTHVTPSSIQPLLESPYFQASPTNASLAASAHPGSVLDNLHSGIEAKTCPHDYLILLCSQKTRDARCGQSAPLLKREFERHLRPLGLYRDMDDERPGGVGIYFISHVGGHKYSANVLVYRSTKVAIDTSKASEHDDKTSGEAVAVADSNGLAAGLEQTSLEQVSGDQNGKQAMRGDQALETLQTQKPDEGKEAAQCIWLARVRPEDCENIIRYTVLQGKVVKPERQLRGGFDRCTGKVSW